MIPPERLCFKSRQCFSVQPAPCQHYGFEPTALDYPHHHVGSHVSMDEVGCPQRQRQCVLKLREGIVANRYCEATVVQRRFALRRAATAEAAVDLGRIVSVGTAKRTGAIWKASVSKVGDAVTGASVYREGCRVEALGESQKPTIRAAARGRVIGVFTSSDRMMGVSGGQPGSSPISWKGHPSLHHEHDP